MADQNSTQYALQLSSTAGGARVPSRDYKDHFLYVNHTPAAQMSANDVLNLIRLDAGATRILQALWHIKHDAFGAGRTLNFGHRAYRTSDNQVVAQNLTYFGSAYDAAGAQERFLNPQLTNPLFAPTFDNQVILTCQVVGGTWDAGVALELIIALNKS